MLYWSENKQTLKSFVYVQKTFFYFDCRHPTPELYIMAKGWIILRLYGQTLHLTRSVCCCPFRYFLHLLSIFSFFLYYLVQILLALHFTCSALQGWRAAEGLVHKYETCFKVKGKGKGRLWVLQHWCLDAYSTLTQMSSFIHLQRRCTHQAAWETSASEGRNYTCNLAINP